MAQSEPDNQSLDDQNDAEQAEGEETPPSGGGLTRSAVIASAILLLLPAAIPIYFLPDAPNSRSVMLLVGLSVIVLLGNALLLLMLVRWFRQLSQ